MQYKVFVIYDSKVEAYLTPNYFRNVGEAQRVLGNLVNDPNHQFGKHAVDYTLFEIGVYDDQSGKIVSHDVKYSVCGLHELKNGFANASA